MICLIATVIKDEEVPYLRVANVQRGYLDLSEIKTIRIPSDKLETLLLETGDILFNEGGDIDKLGRGWVWEGQIARCSFQNHVFRARLYDQNQQPKYISWWGNYRGLDYFLSAGKQTTNLASINKTMLSKLSISLPPYAEQHEIVRRVEALFAYADHLDARYRTARAQVVGLASAILAKAFRGELVPQDPNDEPASVLLERIRKQFSDVPKQVPKSRKKTTTQQKELKQQRRPTMIRSRRDSDVKGKAFLTSKLRDLGGKASAEQLFDASDLDIVDFYKQLSDEYDQGWLRRAGDDVEVA